MTSTRIFISHQSACLYWTCHDRTDDGLSRHHPGSTDKVKKKDVLEIRKEIDWISEDEVLHLSVYSEKEKHRITQTSFHYRKICYPFNSFIPITNNYFIASPELCFLQAAKILSFRSLILYGLELCGTYARNNSGTRYKRRPLSSHVRLENYLKASKGATGFIQARNACKYIVDESASVMESVLVTMLILSPALGGFGLPKPLLNHEIWVDNPHAQGEKIVFHGDLVWERAKLVVEYDGGQHGDYDNHALDKQRDHLMLDAGYKVIRFTYLQITNPKEVERLAHTINKLGRYRKDSKALSVDGRKKETQKELLYNSQLPWLK